MGYLSDAVKEDEFPLCFATALFSFLYHLATYEASTCMGGMRAVVGGYVLRLLQCLGRGGGGKCAASY